MSFKFGYSFVLKNRRRKYLRRSSAVQKKLQAELDQIKKFHATVPLSSNCKYREGKFKNYFSPYITQIPEYQCFGFGSSCLLISSKNRKLLQAMNDQNEKIYIFLLYLSKATYIHSWVSLTLNLKALNDAIISFTKVNDAKR